MYLAIMADENLLDIFSLLDRNSLEKLQLLCRRFRRFIDAELRLVCLRSINNASLDLRTYKAYVVEIEAFVTQEKPLTHNGNSCLCGAVLPDITNSAHFLSDWLIRVKGLEKLVNWEPREPIEYKYWNTTNAQRWCAYGRPIREEDLRAFFQENFKRVDCQPYGGCLIFCTSRRVASVYYGQNNRCIVGRRFFSSPAVSYEYYVDRERGREGFCPPPQFLRRVATHFDGASRMLFTALRSSVINIELLISQVVLSTGFATLLDEVGPSIHIAGALRICDTDAKAVAPISWVRNFAELGPIVFEDSLLPSEQLDDAFLLHCLKVGVPSILLPQCPRISVDAILNYCFGSDKVNTFTTFSKEFMNSCDWRVLRLSNPSVTEDFLRNLVKACRACTFDNRVMLVVLDLENFQEQIDWAFHGNRLNAEEFEFLDDWYPVYRFSFRKQDGSVFRVNWCTSTKAMVLQKIGPGFSEHFPDFPWDSLGSAPA